MATDYIEYVEVKPPPDPKRRALLIVVVVVVIALIAAVIYWITTGDDDPPATAPDTTASAAPGTLPTGQASADLTSATRTIDGYPRGFPHTEPGAVEAMTGATSVFMGAVAKPPAESAAYVKDVSGETTQPANDPNLNKLLGVNAQGEFVGTPTRRAYADCLPRFGAYKSQIVTDDEVRVDVWMPCLMGQGAPDDTRDIHIFWTRADGTMVWRAGDWRAKNDQQGGFDYTMVPPDKNRPDVSFAERAELLGSGWKLFQGASESWPQDLLGQELGQ